MCHLASHQVKIQIAAPFHSVRLSSFMSYFPESIGVFWILNWPLRN